MKNFKRIYTACCLALGLGLSNAAQAEELKVLSGNGAKAAHEAAARDMLKFFTTPQAVQILRAAGVDTNAP